MRRLVVLLIALGFAMFSGARAQAAPCTDQPNVVYLQVGDTQVNLMRRLSRLMRDNTAHPVTMMWVANGSCTNIGAIYNDVKVTPTSTPAKFEFAPTYAQDPSWDPANATASPTIKCDPPAAGQSIDIANSALFVSSCPNGPPPPGVKSTFGPIQAYVLAVPEASSQIAISYEEAYFVFGFGMAGMVSPWTDNTQMFTRTITKSTLLTWAANISVPAGKWVNTGDPTHEFDKSGQVVAALKAATLPEKAIGLLGAEVYDGERNNLNMLAFRSKGQRYAYYPDSTSTSRDKRNLRDGHYTVWSPTEWLQKVDGNDTPINAEASYVIGLITNHSVSPAPNFDPVVSMAAVGLVPDCAMKVKRSFDGGPLSLYTPAESCTCKYDALVDVSSCQSCAGGETCGSGVCRNGFCEVP